MKKQEKWSKNLLKVKEKDKNMTPFERFKKLNTEGNLWIYVLSLGKEVICDDEVGKLIFERFGFLPGNILLKSVLYRLRRQGYIQTEKYKGKKAFKTTEKGMKELETMRNFCQELLQKI